MIIPEESMPFTKDGVKPDIIINPHAIPSRMTIGHLVECVFAKLCCMKGVIGDGTVFIPFDESKVYKELGEKGFDHHGNEILYNGFTGQQIQSEIFIGPTFYFRLKHMVADKINVRGHDRDKSELPKVMLTRQPTSGKRKGGGLRIGEMERDSVLSHGASLFMKESMMERSDKYKWAVCKRCGTLAVYNPSRKNRIIQCKLCNKDDLAVVETPYAFKLLVQELQSMGIEMRLNVEDIGDIRDMQLANMDMMTGGAIQTQTIQNIPMAEYSGGEGEVESEGDGEGDGEGDEVESEGDGKDDGEDDEGEGAGEEVSEVESEVEETEEDGEGADDETDDNDIDTDDEDGEDDDDYKGDEGETEDDEDDEKDENALPGGMLTGAEGIEVIKMA